MPSYSEIVTIGASAATGYIGKILQDWWTARQARERSIRERWSWERQKYFLPLLGAARELDERLTELAKVYCGESMAFKPENLSGDFRELYLLSPDEIPDLYNADPNSPRRDQQAVQRLRTRMCRELNFATSSLYKTARYVALAVLVRQVLEEGRSNLPAKAAVDVERRIRATSASLQGATGAGLPTEQQDSIGEIMRSDDERVITQYEFRKRLLDVPGWEQFTALLTFFITEDDKIADRPNAARFVAKVPYEVRATVMALRDLVEALERLTMLATPGQYEATPQAMPQPEEPW